MIEWFSLDGDQQGRPRAATSSSSRIINGHYMRITPEAELLAAFITFLTSCWRTALRMLGRDADVAGLTANKTTVLSALPQLQPRAKTRTSN